MHLCRVNGNRKLLALGALMTTLFLTGCATKNYGRQGELTDYERQTMTCREMELETAKVHGYLAHVEKESQFDGRSVLSFLGDFGMGNVMEKSAAMEAANRRLAQLQDTQVRRGCNKGNETVDPATGLQGLGSYP
ncbi:hypothetical protein ACMHYJ_02125 [Castellaniella hirudinis]|uniref:hypothetical protein n=1 Tax=Castellaniella hirudinis TaxID=1144617 RepID=UPI0039C22247